MEESLEMREENEEPSVPEMRNSVSDRDKLQVSTHMFHVSYICTYASYIFIKTTKI